MAATTERNPMTAATCTVRTATAGACGRPAVYSFRSRVSDEMFHECAEHYAGPVDRAVGTAVRVGDTVEVQRHGRTYTGTVVRVGARGAVYASVTYGNGATREVRV